MERMYETPDLDSDTHERMIRIFNKMLKDNSLEYEVVFIDGGEYMKIVKK